MVTQQVKLNDVKIKKMGNSYALIIPMYFIKSEVISYTKKYDVTLKEVSDES